MISTPQLLRLFEDESKDGIYRRLQKLFHHGYLNRLGTNPNAPLVYSLGRQGAEVLEVSRPKDVRERYVLHQLMIGAFRISVVRSAERRGIEAMWRAVPRGLPVQPDGFFALRFPHLPEGENRSYFCVEVDRSTMPRRRFLEKLEGYQRWHAAGGHNAALGIKSFRVLTVTKSRERLESLLSAAAADFKLASRSTSYWFAAFPQATPDAAFEPIWQTAANPLTRQSLLPASVA